MKLEVKKLKRGNNIIAPLTIAEAVLVKDKDTVSTLDKVINKKVEVIKSTPESGIIVTRLGNIVDVSHTNQIVPNAAPQPMQIQYDNTGHIVNTLPLGKLTISVNSEKAIETNTINNQSLDFGDDFLKDNNNHIIIRWNNYGDI